MRHRAYEFALGPGEEEEQMDGAGGLVLLEGEFCRGYKTEGDGPCADGFFAVCGVDVEL